ncbi:MAG: formate dehydrogenase accessory protein FdhE [Coriobacteriia bacterium]|nr:formate dehydrogenase accessory protein FdhE [Coriobacteriia bacterium]
MDRLVIDNLERYRRTSPGLVPILALAECVWRVQEGFEPPPPDAPDPSIAREALAGGQPLLSAAPAEADAPRFAAAAAALAGSLSECAEVLSETRGGFSLAAEAASGVTTEALEAALAPAPGFSRDALVSLGAKEDGPLTFSLLGFVLSSALTPFLSAYARAAVEALGADPWKAWSSGCCPVCGSPAEVGCVTDEGELAGGRRKLFCAACRSEWPFERLRCARCGTREHTRLRYLYDEADAAHRVHACDACRSYLKVVYERDLGRKASPLVESVVGGQLDELAASRGLTPFVLAS